MVINEPIQIDIPKPLLVENEDFEPINFELVNNNLTHGIITRVDVHVHYHGNVLVCNDQNDIFVEEPINVYTLEVYNLKSHVFS